MVRKEQRYRLRFLVFQSFFWVRVLSNSRVGYTETSIGRALLASSRTHYTAVVEGVLPSMAPYTVFMDAVMRREETIL
jgi:hypothetical protein